jgi:hypothetical protein
MDDAAIKDMVRARYGAIARAAASTPGAAPTCCAPADDVVSADITSREPA